MATLSEVKSWCLAAAEVNGAVFYSDTPMVQDAIKALVSEGKLIQADLGGHEFHLAPRGPRPSPSHGRRLV